MREIMVSELRTRFPQARIIHELPLRYGSNTIDLAAVTETEINAVEIKSSRDVMDRLEKQLRTFAPISTRLIVALAPRWNEKLPSIERPSKHPGARTLISQHTDAQRIISSVHANHVETWTCDAAAGTAAQTDGGYLTNRFPWPRLALDILHVLELEVVAFKHGIAARARHDLLADACAAGMTGNQVMRAVCAALRTRTAFAAASDPPIGAATPASTSGLFP